MDKNEFLEKFKNASTKLDFSNMDNIIKDSLSPETDDKFKGFMNLIVAMEEFNECSQEIAKTLRGKSDKIHLIEETADALLGIRCIQKICDISNQELIQAINVKLERQSEKNKKDNPLNTNINLAGKNKDIVDVAKIEEFMYTIGGCSNCGSQRCPGDFEAVRTCGRFTHWQATGKLL